jgi:rod shape-determining protein MreD
VIVTRRMAIRIALLLLATLIVQVSFFSQLSILGAAPNVVTVVIVSLGLLGGGIVGAVAGFATGFVLDSTLLQTLGVSSLTLLSAGYLAGRYRERGFEVSNRYAPALLAGGLTLFAAAGFAVLHLMLGVDAPVSPLVVREIFVQALLAVALAFGVYPLVRRVVAPALIDYEAPARRRRLVSIPISIPGMRRRRLRTRRAAPATTAAHGARVRSQQRRRRRSGVRGGLA